MTVPLLDLSVVVLDCQATGANPSKGALLEVGWAAARAGDPGDRALPSVQAHLAALPDDAAIPPRVQRMTGIIPPHGVGVAPPITIWQMILDTATTAADRNDQGRAAMVIHFSRFEIPFLQQLHDQYGHGAVFPFEVICTHEISKRLLPDLPRRGLRAMAGYFGHTVPELRRSADHVIATAHIWRHCVGLLAQQEGIATWAELREWLLTSPGSSRSGRHYPMARDVRLSLTDRPGVYRMLRSNGDLLYIGKAKSLKKRVNSYFQKRYPHSEHILEMLSQAKNIDTTVTETALEAAILESDLIKRHSPPYNIALRKRQRSLWYCPRDFSEATTTPGAHFLGPMPGREIIDALSGIVGLVESEASWEGRDEAFCERILCVPPGQGPDVACFGLGAEIFRRQHHGLFRERGTLQAVSMLGTLLWRTHLAEMERRREEQSALPDADGTREPDEDDDAEADSAWVWTADAVAHGLEGAILSAVLGIRRSRWYCMLSEAVLVWSHPNGGSSTGRQMLVLDAAGVVCTRRLGAGDPVDPPTGKPKPWRARQAAFDIAAYDRMRVLTTELRRLLTEDRSMSLYLGSRVCLDQQRLQRILPWV